MLERIKYKVVIMKSPFDDTYDITKQEIANFVFWGRKNRFDKLKFSYNDLHP